MVIKKSNKNIKVVLFDLDNTLYPHLLERKKTNKDIKKIEFNEFTKNLNNVFKEIKKMGIKIGIVTNSDYNKASKRVKDLKIEKYLDLIVALNKCRKKPFPDLFYRAIKKLEVKPFEILYVGDNFIDDILGSKFLGIKTVLFKYNSNWYHKKIVKFDLLHLIAPDFLIEDLKDVPRLIKNMTSSPD